MASLVIKIYKLRQNVLHKFLLKEKNEKEKKNINAPGTGFITIYIYKQN